MAHFFIGIIIIAIAAAVGWFGTQLAAEGWKRWKHPEPIGQSQSLKDLKLKEPTFSEKIDTVDFSLGERGITVGYSISALEKGAREPFMLNNFSPVRVYVKNGKP